MKKKFSTTSVLVIFTAIYRGIRNYRLWALLVCYFLFNETRAQYLSPTVLSTAGNSGTSANCIIDWTLGEIAIETYTQTSSILTQGFHQNFTGFPNKVEFTEHNEISFYPNPVRDVLFLTFKQPLKTKYQVELFNTKGLKIRNTTLEPLNKTEKININDLPEGIYLIKISTVHGEILMTRKFVKH